MKRFLLALLCMGVFVSNANAERIEWPDKPGEFIYVTQLKIAKGIAVQIDFNNIIIARLEGQGLDSYSGAPNDYIVKGENELKIHINEVIDTGADPDGDIQINFHAIPKGSIMSEETVIANYSTGDITTDDAFSVISLSFEASHVPPQGDKAPTSVASLTSEDEEQIKQIIQKLINSWKEEDADAYYDIFKYKSELSSIKQNRKYDAERQMDRSKMLVSKAKDDFGDIDFDFNDLELVGVNDNKYFVTRSKSAQTTFIHSPVKRFGNPIGLNLVFSKASDGEWYVSSTAIILREQPVISDEVKQGLAK